MNSTAESCKDADDESQEIWLEEDMMVASGGSVRVVSEIKAENIL